MKFISTKKVVDYANDLARVQARKTELREELKNLDTEEESLIAFLNTRSKGETFQFNGEDNYLMVLEFAERTRKILDQKKARLRLLEAGLKVPVRTSTWTAAEVRYATDAEVE